MYCRESKNILVIDDCWHNQLLMKLILESQGYSSKFACNGREGLAEVEKEVPNLIVLDMMMPDMSGLDVIACLRGNNEYTKIPILLCTAHRYLDKEDVNRANDICYKPFDIDDLLAKIQNLIDCCGMGKGSTLLINISDDDPIHNEHQQLLAAFQSEELKLEALREQGYEVVNR